MANAQRGEASFDANGTTYTLVFDHNAMCEAEDAADTSINVLIKRAAQGRISAIRAVVWGALRRRHPDVTLMDVGDMLGAHLGVMADALNRAVAGGFGPAVETAEGREPGKSIGKTGSKSGAKRA